MTEKRIATGLRVHRGLLCEEDPRPLWSSTWAVLVPTRRHRDLLVTDRCRCGLPCLVTDSYFLGTAHSGHRRPLDALWEREKRR